MDKFYIMVRGDARTPQRFWEYVCCYSKEQEERLRRHGFVRSLINQEAIKNETQDDVQNSNDPELLAQKLQNRP